MTESLPVWDHQAGCSRARGQNSNDLQTARRVLLVDLKYQAGSWKVKRSQTGRARLFKALTTSNIFFFFFTVLSGTYISKAKAHGASVLIGPLCLEIKAKRGSEERGKERAWKAHQLLHLWREETANWIVRSTCRNTNGKKHITNK